MGGALHKPSVLVNAQTLGSECLEQMDGLVWRHPMVTVGVSPSCSGRWNRLRLLAMECYSVRTNDSKVSRSALTLTLSSLVDANAFAGLSTTRRSNLDLIAMRA